VEGKGQRRASWLKNTDRSLLGAEHKEQRQRLCGEEKKELRKAMGSIFVGRKNTTSSTAIRTNRRGATEEKGRMWLKPWSI